MTNTFASEGLPPPSAPPPPPPPSSDLDRAREALARSEQRLADEDALDREAALPAWERGPAERPRDLDSAEYLAGDVRQKLNEPVAPELIEQPQEKPVPAKPASWSKEKWEALDDSTRALIYEDEERREEWHRSRQSEIDKSRHSAEQQVRQQYQEHIQAADQARQAQVELATISAEEARLVLHLQNAENSVQGQIW